MIAADNTQSWLDQHQSLQLIGQNHAWLRQLRSAALQRFEKIGLPGIRDEQWRYTNLRALKSNAYQVSSAGGRCEIELPSSDNPRLVFVDGHLDSQMSTPTALDGIVFQSMAALLESGASELEASLNTTLPSEPHGFSSLNSAFFQDGYAVILANSTVAKAPLEIYFVTQQEGSVSHCRNIIVAGANSQCTVIERHLGKHGSVYLNNSITEVIAADNAHIDHYKIQQESDDAFHIGGVFIKQFNSSQVKNHNVALSGLVTRNDTHCQLLGQGAHVEMNGLVLGQGRQHIDNHTEVNHVVPNCTSDEYYKTVLDDQSRSVFRGRIVVAQDAQLTNADQQNNNLLLSKNAEADTKPQLEIYADDVKCSHGATVGQLDPKSMFYLMSRGINYDSARALLTFAFANQVIERIQLDSVREELTHILAGELLAGLEELV